jgi:hypothetical protein
VCNQRTDGFEFGIARLQLHRSLLPERPKLQTSCCRP